MEKKEDELLFFAGEKQQTKKRGFVLILPH